MKSGEASELLAELTGTPLGTVRDAGHALRQAGVLRKGQRGPHAGADMTSRDMVSWLLAILVDRPYGTGDEGYFAAQDRVRRLFVDDSASINPEAARASGLTCFTTEYAGMAIEYLIEDFRHGRIRPELKPWLHLHASGQFCSVSIKTPELAAVGFVSAKQQPPPLVERSMTIDGRLLRRIADALGSPNN